MIWQSGVARLKRKTVVVSMLSGELIQGVLVGAYTDSIALRHARELSQGEDVKGDLLIPLNRIDYFQVPG